MDGSSGYTLEVDDLRVELAGGVDIVDGVSFRIAAGEVLGVVGESGSGKTTVGLAVLGHYRRGARIVGGEIRIDGTNILTKSAAELRSMRGLFGWSAERTLVSATSDAAAAVGLGDVIGRLEPGYGADFVVVRG